MARSISSLFGNTDLEQALSPRANIQEQLLKRNLIRTGLSLVSWLLVGAIALPYIH